MTDSVWAVNAVTGAPAFSGKQGRQTASPLVAGATTARPLGSVTGVRPGTPSSTVTATSTTWTAQPFAGIADVASSAIAGPFQFAFDAVATGAVTAANATNPRVDIIYVQIDDPAEGDGSSVPAVTRKYFAGTAAPSPVAPALPVSRAFVIANINVPVSGGGSPTVTWNAPYTVAAGAPLLAQTLVSLQTYTGYLQQRGIVFADTTVTNNGDYIFDGTNWVRGINTNLQLDTTNSLVRTITQYGIGRITGVASPTISESVTYPVPFLSTPVVLVTVQGFRPTAAFNPAVLTATAAWATASAIGTSVFTANLLTSGGNFGTANDYYYGWSATGSV